MLDILLLADGISKEQQSTIMWEVVKVGTPIVIGLATAVSVLWRAVYKQMNDTKKDLVDSKAELTAKLDKCEEKHKEQHIWAMEMSTKIGQLEGQMEGHAQAREDLRTLSERVVVLLDNLNTN